MNQINYKISSGKTLVIGHQFDHNKTSIKFDDFVKEKNDSDVYLKIEGRGIYKLTNLGFTVTQRFTLKNEKMIAQLMELHESTTGDVVLNVDDSAVKRFDFVSGSDVFYMRVLESVDENTEIIESEYKFTLLRDELNALAAEIQQKVDDGEFDGEDGFSPTVTTSKVGDTTTIVITDKDGSHTVTIKDGTNGYTPVKGTDYFTNAEIASFKADVTPVKGVDYSDGSDGISPTVAISKNGNSTVISITDKDGVHTATLTDGTPGTDGYSPTVSISKSGKNTTITITDRTGNHTATITDGNDGSDASVTLQNIVAALGFTPASSDKINHFIVTKESDIDENTKMYFHPTDTYTEIPEMSDLEELSDDLATKVTEPTTAQVGQIFKVASIDADGHYVMEAINLPTSTDVQINRTSITEDGVANIPIMSTSNYGVAKIYSSYGVTINGSGQLMVSGAYDDDIDRRRTDVYRALMPKHTPYIVKSALTSETDPAWTSSEQNKALARLNAEPKHGNWELIDTITVESNCTSLLKDSEPNGTPYNFKDIMILYTANGTWTEKVAIGFVINDTATYSKSIFRMDYGGQTNGSYTIRCIVENHNGMYIAKTTAENVDVISGGNNAIIYGSNKYILANSITKVGIVTYQENKIKAGAKIQIYAVRA